MKIRTTTAGDIPALRAVLETIDLFPAEMLADMAAPFLQGAATEALWLTCAVQGVAQGFCFAEVEVLTEGTWNMRAIGVSAAMQGQGVGTALTSALEDRLRARAARILIVDTSGTDAFATTRSFYTQNGYVEEARIRDFWAAGDDKVIFRKAL